MYGLPPQIELAFLVGPRLEQVAIGENEIIFRFESAISLNVQGVFEIRSAMSESSFTSPPEAAQQAVALLGHTITEETHASSGDMWLIFDNGAKLVLHDSSAEYESYEIRRGDDLWVV